MKTLPPSILLMSASLLAFSGLQAQNHPLKKNSSVPLSPKEANERTGLNQVMADLHSDPKQLFIKLDTDQDGKLTPEEFERIATTGASGTSSNAGTVGIKGASGATGITGATRVGDDNTAKGATGNPEETTGQQPATDNQGTGNAKNPVERQAQPGGNSSRGIGVQPQSPSNNQQPQQSAPAPSLLTPTGHAQPQPSAAGTQSSQIPRPSQPPAAPAQPQQQQQHTPGATAPQPAPTGHVPARESKG